MKVLQTAYTFSPGTANSGTVTLTGLNVPLNQILLITDTTYDTIIYNPYVSGNGAYSYSQGANSVITLALDTHTLSSGDSLQIFYDDASSIPSKSTTVLTELSPISAQPVMGQPQSFWRASFDAVKATGSIDTTYFSLITPATGTKSGQTVAQSTGSVFGYTNSTNSLAIGAGTTANDELILRSVTAWKGKLDLKVQSQLSNRIVNNNFFIELVDILGDALSVTINSATQITVTFLSNSGLGYAQGDGYAWTTALNVGQTVYVGNYSGSGTFVPQKFTIATASAGTVTLTGAGMSAGSGTCSVWGWNYIRLLYTSTTATNVAFDCQRNGWSIGDTTGTCNTTASPGHLAYVHFDGQHVDLLDSLVGSTATTSIAQRATRLTEIPDQNNTFYLQIRSTNGTTNPASGTTWNIGFASIEMSADLPVRVNGGAMLGGYSGVSMTPAQGNLPTNITQLGGTGILVLSPNGTGSRASVSCIGGPITLVDYNAQAWAAASGNGALIGDNNGLGSVCSFDVNLSVWTVNTSTGLNIVLQWSPDNGTSWYDIWHCETLTATGHIYIPAIYIPGRRRMRWAHTSGSATTATVTVTAMEMSMTNAAHNIRQYFDRTANILNGTLNAVTSAYDVSGCKSLTAAVVLGAATTAGTYQFQVSDDGANFANVGSATLAVASATTTFSVQNVIARFARLICTLGGSVQTGTYVSIKGVN